MSSQDWTINRLFFSKCNLSFMVLFGSFSSSESVQRCVWFLAWFKWQGWFTVIWDKEMLPCGWWERSALAKCPSWHLPIGSWRSCSGPLPQKCGRICLWGAPWGLGRASVPFTSIPEINGCPDASCVSPAGTMGCHWCAKVGQQRNNTLEGEEEVQRQCCWCDLRSCARWCGRQHPSHPFPSSLAIIF